MNFKSSSVDKCFHILKIKLKEYCQFLNVVHLEGAGYLLLRYPGILGRRKWRPKEEIGRNGRAREGERERERGRGD